MQRLILKADDPRLAGLNFDESVRMFRTGSTVLGAIDQQPPKDFDIVIYSKNSDKLRSELEIKGFIITDEYGNEADFVSAKKSVNGDLPTNFIIVSTEIHYEACRRTTLLLLDELKPMTKTKRVLVFGELLRTFKLMLTYNEWSKS